MRNIFLLLCFLVGCTNHVQQTGDVWKPAPLYGLKVDEAIFEIRTDPAILRDETNVFIMWKRGNEKSASSLYYYMVERNLTAESELPPRTHGVKINQCGLSISIAAPDQTFEYVYALKGDERHTKMYSDYPIEHRYVQIGRVYQYNNDWAFIDNNGVQYEGENALKAATILWLRELDIQQKRIEVMWNLEKETVKKFKELDHETAVKRGYVKD